MSDISLIFEVLLTKILTWWTKTEYAVLLRKLSTSLIHMYIDLTMGVKKICKLCHGVIVVPNFIQISQFIITCVIKQLMFCNLMSISYYYTVSQFADFFHTHGQVYICVKVDSLRIKTAYSVFLHRVKIFVKRTSNIKDISHM